VSEPETASVSGTSPKAHLLRRAVLLVLLLTSLLSCNASKDLHPEIVMTPGMKLTARTPSGTITITANEGYKRTYQWGSCSKTVTLSPRHERWLGQKGIFYPAPGITWLFGCEGIHRADLEESQLHFGTEQEFLMWISQYKGVPYVYTNDGLMVGFRTFPDRMIVIVEVHQVFIDGKKPSRLHDADDASISVTRNRSPEGKAGQSVGDRGAGVLSETNGGCSGPPGLTSAEMGHFMA